MCIRDRYQGLAAGAEHLGDAPGRPVEKFKGLLPRHGSASFRSESHPYSNAVRRKKQGDLQRVGKLIYWRAERGNGQMTGISAQERRRAVARALEEADGPVSATALALSLIHI